MKFTDGYWKVNPHFTLFQTVSINEVLSSEHEVKLYVSAQKQGGRSALGGVTLEVTLFAPKEDIIGVKIQHHLDELKKRPFFYCSRNCGLIEKNDSNIILRSGKMEAKIRRDGEWKIQFFYNGKFLTENGWRSTGYAVSDSRQAFVKEELLLSVGEKVYGLGERFTEFIKNGQHVEIWNQDGGTSSEQAYKNIPFYVTNRNYGVLIHDSGKVELEVASEKVERVQFSTRGEILEYCVIGGDNLMEVIKNYNHLTGMPSLPPSWSFGLWLTTSFTTDYNEETVNHFIDGMLERNIPLQVFHFDCFWMKGSHWCDFQWDRDAFPEPEDMILKIKQKGLKVCVWINPYIAQRSQIFEEGVQQGYFLKKVDGRVWQTDEWQPGMAIVDFTNPDAVCWYQNHLKKLLEMGVDTFKTDFGEYIPVEGIQYFDGSSPERMHNFYAYLYNQAVFQVLKEVKGEGEAMVFARAATVGGQKFPVHWGGDCVASYQSMAESLRGGLSLALSGFGFWSHDMGGFENCATPDLYKRWVAFGMFSTHSRLHGNSTYRVPWLFDEEAVDVLRFFSEIKCYLMPYYFAQAVKTHETGIPMMRPMVMEFPEEMTCEYLDKQYMLGDSLLVAPVFSDKGEAVYYLPEGKWTHLLTGCKEEGGWKKEYLNYFELPVYVKENTVLPVGKEKRTVYEYETDIELRIYELLDKAECKIYRNDGRCSGDVKAVRIENELRITVTGLSRFTILLCQEAVPVEIFNGEGEMTKEGFKVIPERADEEIILKI